jgi:hypothetical protein
MDRQSLSIMQPNGKLDAKNHKIIECFKFNQLFFKGNK